MARKEICGALIWQFCDTKVTSEGKFFLTRPGTRNNKGVVDRYRRKKLSFATVCKWFQN